MPFCESSVTVLLVLLAIQILPDASAASAEGALMLPVNVTAMVKSLGCVESPVWKGGAVAAKP